MGDFAIIHARTRYTTADGNQGPGATPTPGAQNGRWLACRRTFRVTKNRHSGRE